MFGFGDARELAWHHDHEHNDHDHHHDQGGGVERSTALLAYMVGHNRSHAEELHELAHQLDGDVADLIHDAVGFFEQGNAKLDEALAMLKGE